MASDSYDYDAQDQAELFDEDNLDGEPGGVVANEFKTFEEIPDVLDVTRARGDSRDDDVAVDEADFQDGQIDDEDLEDDETDRNAELFDDSELESEPDVDAEDGVLASPRGEVDLVYAADVDNRRGAQSSAAHFESRQLADDDLEDLGYADKDRS